MLAGQHLGQGAVICGTAGVESRVGLTTVHGAVAPHQVSSVKWVFQSLSEFCSVSLGRPERGGPKGGGPEGVFCILAPSQILQGSVFRFWK